MTETSNPQTFIDFLQNQHYSEKLHEKISEENLLNTNVINLLVLLIGTGLDQLPTSRNGKETETIKVLAEKIKAVVDPLATVGSISGTNESHLDTTIGLILENRDTFINFYGYAVYSAIQLIYMDLKDN